MLRARALIARGEYAKAESLLTGPASATPASDAALELGLLQLCSAAAAKGAATLQLLLLADARDPPRPATTPALLARRARSACSRTPTRTSAKRSRWPPTTPSINTEWGELFLEKHNRQDAAKSFQAALKTEPDYAPAQRGMAQAVADENPPAAMRYVRRALELNPSDAAAYLFLAELAIDEDKKDLAREAHRQGAGHQPQQPRGVRPDGRRSISSRARTPSTRRPSPRR